MKGSITLNFKWHDLPDTISDDLKSELKDHAVKSACRMLNEDHLEGTLVYLDGNTDYLGRWEAEEVQTHDS